MPRLFGVVHAPPRETVRHHTTTTHSREVAHRLSKAIAPLKRFEPMDNAERTDSTTERTNAERTIEMVLPASETAASRPDPVFPQSTNAGRSDSPKVVSVNALRLRSIPFRAPRVGRFAKWIMLVGILFFCRLAARCII